MPPRGHPLKNILQIKQAKVNRAHFVVVFGSSQTAENIMDFSAK